MTGQQRVTCICDGLALYGLRVGPEPVAYQPEKRKVGSSALPLTTSSRLVSSALNSTSADWAHWCLQSSSDHDCPCVTLVGRSLSHADRTSSPAASDGSDSSCEALDASSLFLLDTAR